MSAALKPDRGTYVPGLEDGGWRGKAAELARLTGLLRLSTRSTAASVIRSGEYRCAILYYHRIGTGGVPVYNGLPTALFEAQMRYLRQNYRIVSLRQFCAEAAQGSPARPTVVVTFDDGYKGTYSEALPILRKYEIPALVYLTVGCIETGDIAWYDKIFLAFQLVEGSQLQTEVNGELKTFALGSKRARLGSALMLIRLLWKMPNADRITFCDDFQVRFPLPKTATTERMLTWEQVREMQKAGISFGAHTWSHPVVSRLTDDEIGVELGQSKELAEKRIGVPVTDFAFPFGSLDACDQKSIQTLRTMGYESAATTVEGINSRDADPFLLRRTSVIESGNLSLAMLKLDQLFRRGPNQRIHPGGSVVGNVQGSLRSTHA